MISLQILNWRLLIYGLYPKLALNAFPTLRVWLLLRAPLLRGENKFASINFSLPLSKNKGTSPLSGERWWNNFRAYCRTNVIHLYFRKGPISDRDICMYSTKHENTCYVQPLGVRSAHISWISCDTAVVPACSLLNRWMGDAVRQGTRQTLNKHRGLLYKLLDTVVTDCFVM